MERKGIGKSKKGGDVTVSVRSLKKSGEKRKGGAEEVWREEIGEKEAKRVRRGMGKKGDS